MISPRSRFPIPCIPSVSIRPACSRVRSVRRAEADRPTRSEMSKMADAHAKPHHDYHLVEPSPWPIVGSVSTFILAVGLISWMKHIYPAAPYVFAIGALGVLYTMLGWWRDVAREATYRADHTQVGQSSTRTGWTR